MRYDSDLLYRPPGEWKSYLLQCTIGCSNNKCTFCGMYKEKQFRIRPTEEILEDIDMARAYYGPRLQRVFLMDGDAIIIKTEDMLRILHKLYSTFPELEKVTVYAGPRSTLSKSLDELKELHKAGLSRAYLGVESGSEAVLEGLGDELVVGTINLGDIPRNTVLTYPINLPEGVTNLSGVTETEINIAFTGLLTKTFVLETVQCVNLPEGMEADIITQELTVEIRGPSALVQKLTEADIRAVVDFTGAEAETASYKVTIQFSEDFTGLGAVKTYTVNATVRPAEE